MGPQSNTGTTEWLRMINLDITGEQIIVILTLLVIFAETTYLVYYLNRQNAPVRTTVVHLVGIFLFVPLVFLLAFLGKIGENTVSTLLGAFAGYIFGKISLKEEWGG